MKKILYVLPLLAVLALTGCTTAKNDDQAAAPIKTVKLGVIAPMSGDAQVIGQEFQKMMDYYLPKVNERHAKDKVKFELVYEDGKCSGSDAVSAFQKLTDIDGIKFIIGGSCSTETLALAPLTKSGEVMTVSVASSNPQINKASDYSFTFSFSDDLVGKRIAQEMSKYKKVAIISEQNDYNIGLEQTWVEALKQYPGATIVANEKFPKGGSDFRNVLEKVKQTQPDAIFLNPNAGVTGQNLTKQLAEIKDWKGYHLFGTIAYTTTSILSIAPDLVEGMTIVDAPKITNPEFQQIKADVVATHGSLDDIGDYYTAATMDDLNILTDLIVEFGENPREVRNAFVTRDFHGYISDSFNFKNGSFPNVGASLYTIKNNKPEFVN